MPSDLDRYHRQMLLPGIGEAGQRRLREAHVLVVGCGALGSMIVDGLARAGVGTLSIVDRDVVEITNLQRQVLFDETDVARGAPKAAAAREKVARINGDVEVISHVDDFNAGTAERFAEGADLLLDGLDNFETRYLLNDLAVSRGVPYVYGGAVGTTGMTMPVLPHPRRRRGPARSRVRWSEAESSPCLRCVFPELPPPGAAATCDTAGVLASVVSTVVSMELTQAIKLLTGHLDLVDRRLVSVDVWRNEDRRFDPGPPRAECRCCGGGRFEFLEGVAASATETLCGRNAIQIASPGSAGLDLAAIGRRLEPFGRFAVTEHLLRGTFAGEAAEGEPLELTLFANGRAIIKGTTEPALARSIYARYVGS